MIKTASSQQLDSTSTNRLKEQKIALRQQMLKNRKIFVNQESKSKLDSSLLRILSNFLKRQSGLWTSYRPYKFEADPQCSIEEIKWIYPRITENKLSFYTLSSKEPWEVSSFGIEEPALIDANKVKIDQISGFIVPGVAFDREGGRLGHGRGYYDAYFHKVMDKLSNRGDFNNIPKIGVAYSVQVCVEPIPMEEHDIKVNTIVTEKEIIHCGPGHQKNATMCCSKISL